MIQETMSRIERFNAAVALEKPDRVPVMPLMTAFAVRAQGLTQGQGWREVEPVLRLCWTPSTTWAVLTDSTSPISSGP